MTKTLILAIGSVLRGDDGVGAAVIDALQDAELPPDVDTLDGGTPGFEMLLLMQGYERVIVVDAADMGRNPGEWLRFTPDEVRLQARDMYLRGTLHYAGLAEALSLGSAMGMLPGEIIVYGVQPESIDWVSELSPAVQAAVPAVCDDLLQAL